MGYKTTIWENVKIRTRYLQQELLFGEGAEWARAICEELEQIHARIDNMGTGDYSDEEIPGAPRCSICGHLHSPHVSCRAHSER